MNYRSRHFSGAPVSADTWPKERALAMLSQSYWFGTIAPRLQHSIINRGEVRHFRAGRSIYKIGDRVDGMHAALAGDLRTYLTGDDGNRILIGLVGPGAWFGAAFQTIEKVPVRDFEIRASSPCITLFLPTDQYNAILAEDPGNYSEFVKLVSIHMRFLIRMMVESRSNAERRTARALLRIAKLHGRDVETGVELALKLNQSDFASIVGVSRQYINELIARWNADGLLVWKGTAQPVLNISKIKQLLTPHDDDWLNEPEGWA